MIDCPIPCHEVDAQGVIRKVNQAECELLGYTAGELIGHHIWEFVPTEDVQVVRRATEQKIPRAGAGGT
jgi:PAS domain S-box-containing protein